MELVALLSPPMGHVLCEVGETLLDLNHLKPMCKSVSKVAETIKKG